jgi:hypothetical protein
VATPKVAILEKLLKIAIPPPAAKTTDKTGARIPIANAKIIGSLLSAFNTIVATNPEIILKQSFIIPTEKKPVSHAKMAFEPTGSSEPPTANGPSKAVSNIQTSIIHWNAIAWVSFANESAKSQPLTPWDIQLDLNQLKFSLLVHIHSANLDISKFIYTKSIKST